MARNGSGTFSRLYDWTDDAAASVKISSTRMDAEMDGMATALTDSIAKDGQTTPTANLPMGNFKHTGVANATARTHYAAAGQVQDSTLLSAVPGGTADAITLTLAPAITAYAANQKFHFIAGGTNTGAVTVNVSGVGATAVKKRGGSALVAGDIVTGQSVVIVHDGTDFELVNPADYATFAGTNTFSGTNNFDGAVDFDSTVDLSGAVIQGATPLVFEGATANDFETSVAVTDPTADQTITLPNATGTVALVGTSGSIAMTAVQLIAHSAVAVSAGAVTTEETLATITVPANAMGANGRLHIRAYWTNNNDASLKTMRLRFSGAAGTVFFTAALTTTTEVAIDGFIANRNATNSQASSFLISNQSTASSLAITTGAIDTTAATTIVLTGQKADAADTITLESYSVELLR